MLRSLIYIPLFEMIFARNLITLETCNQCKSQTKPFPIDFAALSFASFNNTISFDGTFTVLTDIKGIINLELDTTRCTMHHMQCQKFSKLKFDDICGKFINSKVLGDRFVSAIKPQLACPFKRGVYHTENVILNLEFAANLPFDGYSWAVVLKLTGPGKKIFGCYEAVAQINGKASKRQYNTKETCLGIQGVQKQRQ